MRIEGPLEAVPTGSTTASPASARMKSSSRRPTPKSRWKTSPLSIAEVFASYRDHYRPRQGPALPAHLHLQECRPQRRSLHSPRPFPIRRAAACPSAASKASSTAPATTISVKQRSLFTDILHTERTDGTRLVAENDGYVLFCPFASRFPFELAIFPKRHHPDFVSCTAERTPRPGRNAPLCPAAAQRRPGKAGLQSAAPHRAACSAHDTERFASTRTITAGTSKSAPLQRRWPDLRSASAPTSTPSIPKKPRDSCAGRRTHECRHSLAHAPALLRQSVDEKGDDALGAASRGQGLSRHDRPGHGPARGARQFQFHPRPGPPDSRTGQPRGRGRVGNAQPQAGGDLDDEDRRHLIENFFKINWDTLVRPVPRYAELLAKRGANYTLAKLDSIVRTSSAKPISAISRSFIISSGAAFPPHAASPSCTDSRPRAATSPRRKKTTVLDIHRQFSAWSWRNIAPRPSGARSS